jgi:hypothetical protein
MTAGLLGMISLALFAGLPLFTPLHVKAARYSYGPASPDGIGKYYMGREISQIMGHRGAQWLERPEREREERPSLLIESLDLERSQVVADIGAGTGYFTWRLAEAVGPNGLVYAACHHFPPAFLGYGD